MRVPQKEMLTLATMLCFWGCAKAGRAGVGNTNESTKPGSLNSDAPSIKEFDAPTPINAGNAGDGLSKKADNSDDNAYQDLEELQKDCGIRVAQGEKFTDRNLETVKTVLTYGYVRLIHAGFGVAEVPLKSELNLVSTLGATTLDVKVNYDAGTLTGNIQSNNLTEQEIQKIADRAEKLTNIFRGPASAELLVAPEVSGRKEWKQNEIFCTVTAASKIVNKRNGFETVTEFDPPVPANISPIAMGERYEEELGEIRFFHNVKATIKSRKALRELDLGNPMPNTVAVHAPGEFLLGNVVIQKVPAKKKGKLLRYRQASGKYEEIPFEINADLAYRISNHFGSREDTLSLGFHLWTEYYIDLSQTDRNKRYVAIIADVGDDEIMHFFRDKPIDVKD